MSDPNSSSKLEKEVKPVGDASQGGAGDSGEYVRIRVMGQDTSELHFRIKRNTTFSKLMKSYADRVGVSLTALRFIFDGNRINDSDTPISLDMLEDDVVEVYQEQVGGACSIFFA